MVQIPLGECPPSFGGLFSNNVTRKFKMTKTLAILLSGLFAASVFAQAPAAPAAKKEEAKPAAAAAKKEEAKPAAKPAAKKEEAKPAAKKEEAKK